MKTSFLPPVFLTAVAACAVILGPAWMLAAAESPATTTAPEQTVGVLGDPDALEFDGNHTFPSSELREALAVSADYLLAAHPFAPLSGYPASVRAALLRGYRNEGFPDAAITVTPDVARNKVRVQITEGPRFLAGDLSVEGVQAAPAAELVRALTEAHPGAADPIFAAEETVLADQRTAQNIPAEDDNPDTDIFWEHGKPVDFDDDFAGSAEARTRRELAARGYPLAEVKAVLRRDNAARVAHLVLHVQEGPRAVIGEIQVTGLQRNTREDLLACAGLVPGAELTTGVITRAKLALWNSARFFDFDLTTRPRPAPAREVDISIAVDENGELPPLSQPLSPYQAVLVRFANWVTIHSSTDGFSLAFASASAGKVGLALAPGKGLALITEGENLTKLGFVAGESGSRIFALADRQGAGHEFSLVPLTLTVTASFVTTPATSPAGSHGESNFGIHWDGKMTAASGQLLHIGVLMSPSFAVEFLPRKTTPNLANGELSLAVIGGPPRLRCREDTGEFVEWNYNDADTNANLRRGDGELDRLQALLHQAWATIPPPTPAGASLAELIVDQPQVQLLLSAVVSNDPGYLRSRVVARLAAQVFSSSLAESLWTRATNDNDFYIPDDIQGVGRPGTWARVINSYAHGLLAPLWSADTWPGQISREMFYILTDQTKYTDAVIEALDRDPGMGPLGSMVLAKFLERSNPAMADRFARRARTHATPEDFRRDWAALLDGRSEAGRLLQDVLRSLGGLHDDEVAALTAGLSPDDASLVRRGVTALHDHPDLPLPPLLQPLLDEWWTRHYPAVTPGPPFFGAVGAR